MPTINRIESASSSAPNDSTSSKAIGAVQEFAINALYSGVQAPIRGLAQTAEYLSTDTFLATPTKALADCLDFKPPEKAEGALNSAAQELGSIAGTMVPYILLHKAVKLGATKLVGDSTINASVLDATTVKSVLSKAGTDGAVSGTTGLLMGSLLQPVDEKGKLDSVNNKGEFWKSKIKSGLSEGVTFGLLGAGNTLMSKGLSSVSQISDRAFESQNVKTAIAYSLKFPVLPGTLAGAASGVVSSELNALKDGRLATGSEVTKAAASTALIGGMLGATTWLGAQKLGSNMTNSRYFLEKFTGQKLDVDQSANINFRIVDKQENLDAFRTKVAQGDAAQTTIPVRPVVQGIASKFFGPSFDVLGDVRSLTLVHSLEETGSSSTIGARETTGLLATCDQLDRLAATKDVFSGRTTDGGALTVWLNPRVEDRFSISRGEPVVTRTASKLTPELSQAAVALGPRDVTPKTAQQIKVGDIDLKPNMILKIGRHRDNDLRYPESDLSVSRAHAILARTSDGQVWLRDQSSFGTWVNGQKLTPGVNHPIEVTDQIRLGTQNTILTLAAIAKPQPQIDLAKLAQRSPLMPPQLPDLAKLAKRAPQLPGIVRQPIVPVRDNQQNAHRPRQIVEDDESGPKYSHETGIPTMPDISSLRSGFGFKEPAKQLDPRTEEQRRAAEEHKNLAIWTGAMPSILNTSLNAPDSPQVWIPVFDKANDARKAASFVARIFERKGMVAEFDHGQDSNGRFIPLIRLSQSGAQGAVTFDHHGQATGITLTTNRRQIRLPQ